MDFSAFPDDILAPILDYLDTQHILNILSIGNSRLIAGVRRNATKWKCLLLPFSNFPFSLFENFKLHSIEVVSLSVDHLYPLNLSNRSLTSLPVQSSLSSIQFSFPGCLSLLSGTNVMKCLPNLQKLNLNDPFGEFNEQHLENLPPKLIELVVYTRRQHPVALSVDNLVAILPVSLEHLEIRSLLLTLLEPDEASTSLPWPPNLKSISVLGAPVPFILDHGPPLIEHLDAHCITSWHGADGLLSTGRIPRTMKLLRLPTSTDSLGWTLDAPLPPYMEVFSAVCAMPTRDLPLHFFPRSLKCFLGLDIFRSEFLDEPSFHILPNIESLDILHGVSITGSRLPSQLKRLDFHPPLSNALLVDFPKQLTFLSCQPGMDMEFSLLPRSLTHLELRIESSPAPCLGISEWRNLPSSLTHLGVSTWLLDSPSCLSAIPCEKLNSLSISISFSMGARDYPAHNRHMALLNDGCLGSSLPTGLQKLCISMDHIDHAWTSWMADLSHHQSHLHTLEVRLLQYIQSKDHIPPAEEFLSTLPMRLQRLEIPLDEYAPLAANFFSTLPRGLTHLKLTLPPRKMRPRDRLTKITEDHFSDLPPKLHHFVFDQLLLPAATIELTPLVIYRLPLFLSDFPFRRDLLAQADWQQAWAQYRDPAKWLGFPPI
jgi:hypothetical protein